MSRSAGTVVRSIDAGALSLADLRAALHGPVSLRISADARSRIEASHAAVRRILAHGEPVYGMIYGGVR